MTEEQLRVGVDIDEKLRILARIAAALNGAGITYAVGASLLLFLRGIAQGFNDIDLSVLEEDAPPFLLTLKYRGDTLVFATLDGKTLVNEEHERGGTI